MFFSTIYTQIRGESNVWKLERVYILVQLKIYTLYIEIRRICGKIYGSLFYVAINWPVHVFNYAVVMKVVYSWGKYIHSLIVLSNHVIFHFTCRWIHWFFTLFSISLTCLKKLINLRLTHIHNHFSLIIIFSWWFCRFLVIQREMKNKFFVTDFFTHELIRAV